MRIRIMIAISVMCLTSVGYIHAAPAADVPAAAAPNCRIPMYDQRLARRYDADASHALRCVAATEPLTQRLAEWKDLVGKNSGDVASKILAARAELVSQAALLDAQSAATPSLKSPIRTLRDDISAAIEQLDELAQSKNESPSNASKYPALNVAYWKLDGTRSTEPHGLPTQFLFDNGCLGHEPSADCEAAYTLAVMLADDVFVVGNVVAALQSSDRQKIIDEAKLREARWHSYLYNTQFQYWWELGLNYAVERTCPEYMRWDCTEITSDVKGNEIGFREPPNSKLSLLHPDVGLEYLNREPAGSRFKPVIMFQWFGYQHWTWQDSTANGLLGAALVSTVADTSVSRRVGTGLMLQWKKFSVSVTGRPGEVGVGVNLNVIDWVGSVNQEWENKLKAPLPK